MEKLFLFSLEGILYGLTEDGSEKFSKVVFAFLERPWELRKEIVIDMFKETLEQFRDKYNVVLITDDSTKEALKVVMRKRIDYLKANYSNNNHYYWERDLQSVDTPIFDRYNKNVLEEIGL